MRKPYSPEIEQQVIEKYISGDSVREIHDSIGVSVGYISNCIENFSSKMEKRTIDAIHDFYKIIRKTGLHPKDAFSGYAVFSIISKYNLDVNQINSFVESVLLFAKQNELSAEQLVNLCKKLFTVQSRSDIELEELDEHCNTLVNKKKSLEEIINDLNSKYKQSENDLSKILQKKNLTQKQVENIDNVIGFLKKIGFELSDLTSIHDMLQNAKNENYDVSKILDYLNQDQSLVSILQEKQSQLSEIEAKTRKSLKNHENLLLRNENLTLRHDSMLKSIKSVEYLDKKGVAVATISVWQQIFDSFGLEPDAFAKELKNIGDKNKLNCNLDDKKSKLIKEIVHLEKKKSWFENKVDDLKSEISNETKFGKNNLKKITEHAESQINSIVICTKKFHDSFMKQNQTQMNITRRQYEEYFSDLISKLENLLEHSHKAEYDLGQMESLKPLSDLINGKFDPVTSILQIIIILDKLYVNIKDTDLDKYFIHSDIKSLKEKLLDLISHG